MIIFWLLLLGFFIVAGNAPQNIILYILTILMLGFIGWLTLKSPALGLFAFIFILYLLWYFGPGPGGFGKEK